jgi:hypothetical protein
MATDLFATQIRFDYELKDRIQEIADEEKRSFNAQMVYFLEEGVRKHKPKKKIRKQEDDDL